MKLYLMRHGETRWNKDMRLQGCADTELNEKGISLAKTVGEKLRGVEFHRAFTSPLIRAKQTAEYVLQDRNIPLVEDNRIREISFGVWEGLSIRPGKEEIPLHDFNSFFYSPSAYVPPQDGETIEQLYTRTGQFITELLETPAYENENILVAAHGAAVRSMMFNLDTVAVDDFWRGSVPPNCSFNIYEINAKEVLSVERDVIFAEL